MRRSIAFSTILVGCVASCSSGGDSGASTNHHGSRLDARAPVDATARTADARAETGPAEAGTCVPGSAIGEGATSVSCTPETPGRVVVDSDNVYWTNEKAGAVVMKAPLAGGPAQEIAKDTNGAFGLAVDSSYVYFTEPSANRLMRVPIAGTGGATPLATVDAPLHLTSDGASLYFSGGRAPGKIQKLELRDGAAPVTLVDSLPQPRAIAVDDAYVYWTDFTEGAVLRAPKVMRDGGGSAVKIAAGVSQPSDLVVSGGYAYFPDHAGRLLRVAASGGLPEELASVAAAPFGVAVDGAVAYFTTLGDGGVFKVGLGGEHVVTALATAEPDPHFIAAGPSFVYWGNWGNGGSIARAKK